MENIIRTSINLHASTRIIIQKIAAKTDLKISEIICIALNRYVKTNKNGHPIFCNSIKYQPADPGNYKAVAVTFKGTEHDYFTEIRNVFRESASSIISAAIKKYYDLFIDGSISFSCDFISVHFSKGFFYDGVQTWIQHWGEIKEPFIKLYNYVHDPG